MKDVLIIGAGCAGLTAAIYAARAGKSVLVLEQEAVGGQIVHSPRVENYPGIPSISGTEFSDNLYSQADALGVELELETVQEVVPGSPISVLTDSGRHTCRKLIVATGTRHRRLGVPGEEALTGRGVSYCAICDGPFFKGKTVAVVGGGSAALQSAEYLSGICGKVYLIHRRVAFRGEPRLVQRIGCLSNVESLLGATVQALSGSGELTGISVQTAHSIWRLPVDGLFVCVGQESGNAFLRGTLAMDESGYLKAGEDCRTNIPGIFAAGDCRTKQVRQLTTAAADGAVAALAAAAEPE